MFIFDSSVERIQFEPHEYSEHSARAAIFRRRSRGEHWVMRHANGHWYIGQVIERA